MSLPTSKFIGIVASIRLTAIFLVSCNSPGRALHFLKCPTSRRQRSGSPRWSLLSFVNPVQYYERTSVAKPTRWNYQSLPSDLLLAGSTAPHRLVVISATQSGSDDIDHAYQFLKRELKSLPKRRGRDSKRKKTLHKCDDLKSEDAAIRSALESSTSLVQALVSLSIRPEGSGTGDPLPFSRITTKVGPIGRPRVVEMITRHPTSFSRVLLSANIRTKESQLRADLQLSPSEWEKMLRNMTPNVFLRLNRSNIRELIHYYRHDVRMEKEQVRQMLLKCPQLFGYSLSNIRNTVDFFLLEVGFSHDEVCRMIKTVPMVLAYSVKTRLRPTMDFFREEIGSSKWRWIAYRYPQVFSLSVDNVLRPRAEFMLEELCLERWADISQIASKFPPVFWLPEENIRSKMAFLKASLELTTGELRDVIVTYPQVLGLSLEKNLRPTVSFLLEPSTGPNAGAGLTREGLKYFVLYQPALLAYSLEKRLRPRIRRMLENNISFAYSPGGIMSKTNDAFDEWLEMQCNTWSTL